jgi:hypothetical protein
MTDLLPYFDDHDNQVIGWQADAVPDKSSPSGIRRGARQYEIYDGRTISSAGGTDLSISHPGTPLWYGGVTQNTATDLLGRRTTALAGYFEDNAAITENRLFEARPDIIAGTRRIPNVYAFDPQEASPPPLEWNINGRRGWTASVPLNGNPMAGNTDWHPVGVGTLNLFEYYLGQTQPAETREFFLYGGGSGVYNDQPAWDQQASAVIPALLPMFGYSPSDFAGVIGRVDRFAAFVSVFFIRGVGGRNVYYADALVNLRETFNDYDSHWIGKWHDVTDRRDTFSLEWVTKDEDVFGTVPRYATVTKVVPVIQQIQETIWTTEPIVQQQTVLVTERIEQTGPDKTSASFANESLRAGSSIAIDAGTDASFIGLTRATDALGEIIVTAGRDVLLDGARPVGRRRGFSRSRCRPPRRNSRRRFRETKRHYEIRRHSASRRW